MSQSKYKPRHKPEVYRDGGRGFAIWCDEFVRIPIYPEDSDIPVWILLGDLPPEYLPIWEAQKEICYLMAPSRDAAESSPYYEACKTLGYEVLILKDPVDEFVVERIGEFEGKTILSAEKAKLSVPVTADQPGLSEEESKALAGWLKEKLGDQVHEVRVSERLVDSPAVVLDRDPHLTSTMRRTLRAMRQGVEMTAPEGGQDLEVNPRHPVITHLSGLRTKDAELAGQVAEQLLDNARMAAGVLDDPRPMLQRINALLQKLVER